MQEYLSKHPGFKGLIKKRYLFRLEISIVVEISTMILRFEDFIVQEINETGDTAKLTTQDALSDAEPTEIPDFAQEGERFHSHFMSFF